MRVEEPKWRRGKRGLTVFGNASHNENRTEKVTYQIDFDIGQRKQVFDNLALPMGASKRQKSLLQVNQRLPLKSEME